MQYSKSCPVSPLQYRTVGGRRWVVMVVVVGVRVLEEGSAAGWSCSVIEPRAASLVEAPDSPLCMFWLWGTEPAWGSLRSCWRTGHHVHSGQLVLWQEVREGERKEFSTLRKPDGEPVAVETAVQVEGVIPPPGCCQHSGPTSWRLFKDLLEKLQSQKQQHSSAAALY